MGQYHKTLKDSLYDCFYAKFRHLGYFLTELGTYGDSEAVGFTVRRDKQNLGSFKMRQLPGCCGVVVHYYCRVPKNIAGKLLKVREMAAEAAGFTLQLATLREDSKEEYNLYLKAGWLHGQTFVNHKTGNVIAVLSKVIQRKPKKRVSKFGEGE